MLHTLFRRFYCVSQALALVLGISLTSSAASARGLANVFAPVGGATITVPHWGSSSTPAEIKFLHVWRSAPTIVVQAADPLFGKPRIAYQGPVTDLWLPSEVVVKGRIPRAVNVHRRSGVLAFGNRSSEFRNRWRLTVGIFNWFDSIRWPIEYTDIDDLQIHHGERGRLIVLTGGREYIFERGPWDPGFFQIQPDILEHSAYVMRMTTYQRPAAIVVQPPVVHPEPTDDGRFSFRQITENGVPYLEVSDQEAEGAIVQRILLYGSEYRLEHLADRTIVESTKLGKRMIYERPSWELQATEDAPSGSCTKLVLLKPPGSSAGSGGK